MDLSGCGKTFEVSVNKTHGEFAQGKMQEAFI